MKIMKIIKQFLKYISLKYYHSEWDNYINITDIDFYESLYKKYDDLYYNYIFADNSIFVFIYDKYNNCEVFNVLRNTKKEKNKDINISKLGYFNKAQKRFYYKYKLNIYFDFSQLNIID